MFENFIHLRRNINSMSAMVMETIVTRRKILAISGSTRINSSNVGILNAIAILFRDRLDIEVYTQIDELSHFNPEITDDKVSHAVKQFREKIELADGIIICTPEYVFSLPGTLKNALEWTVSTTVFSYKPVAFIVASASGEKAYESLDLILRTLVQVPIPDDVKLLIRGGRSIINEQGVITDEKILNAIKQLVKALILHTKNNLPGEQQ